MISQVWNWISIAVLKSLGLYWKRGKLLFLGLDNSGKTTLMGILKCDRLIAATPTGAPTQEEFELGNLFLTTFDLGGHEQARRVWRDFFPATDGIIFMLDASNPTRFGEAKAELSYLLADEQIANVPLVILANKIDKAGAVSENYIRNYFDLAGFTSGKQTSLLEEIHGRPLELFMCSLTLRQGYAEGIKWLAQFI